MINLPPELHAKLTQIKLIALDVDGVLTDGGLILGDQGDELKMFHVRDGQGLVTMLKNGYELAIITGRKSNVVAQRMAELGVKHVYQGCSDKLAVLNDILEKAELSAAEVAYMGDDLPDLPVIQTVGFGTTVADGNAFVQQHADWISSYGGGKGAVRELCDLILNAHDKLDAVHAQYLVG